MLRHHQLALLLADRDTERRDLGRDIRVKDREAGSEIAQLLVSICLLRESVLG